MSETVTRDEIDLGEFDGIPIMATGVAVRNAGDGLSKSLKVDKVLLHTGETVYVLLECQVGPIKLDLIEEDGDLIGYKRVPDLKTVSATIFDAKSGAKAIAAQKKRIADAAELNGQASIEDEEGAGGEE